MSIKKLIKDIDSTNLAIGMDAQKRTDIGINCYEGFLEDLNNPKRVQWVKDNDDYIKLAMQIIVEKTDPWPGCANIKTPLLTEAAIQFNARAYPALVPARNIVKATTSGDDADGGKSDRGERIGKHMSYQLMHEMEEWEAEQDEGLLILPILGSFFKKTFYNPQLGRNESGLVMPQNLILQYDAPSLARAPRLSEEIKFYPREIEDKKRSKFWVDVDIPYEDEKLEKLETFIEQHVALSLDGSDIKIPYIVTLHKLSQIVVRIVANYTESDIYYDDGTEIVSCQIVKSRIDSRNEQINMGNVEAMMIAQQAGTGAPPQVPTADYPNFDKYKVGRVESTKYYTKYTFLPSPDSGIYDMGLGQLLGPLTDAADTLINQSIDAGTLANNQGGLMAEGVKTPAGTARVNMNEWTKVKTNGMALKDSMFAFNFKGPSAVAFSLLSFLIETAKGVANLKDILSGDAPQGETATTSMIKREEGMRIYNAIYKRVYRAFDQELKKIFALNAQYLPQETYFQFWDTEEAIQKKDYSFDGTDVQPTADPSESTTSQKMMKAEAGLQFVGDPEFNSYELKKRYLEAAEIPNIDDVLPPPSNEPQPPNPELVKTIAEVGKIEAETSKILLETSEVISKVILNLATAESKEAGDQLGALQAHADFLIKKGTMYGKDKQAAAGQGGQEEQGSRVSSGQPLTPQMAASMSGGQPIEARAEGGPVEAGQPYLVGEEGPEIITPAQDGNVIPNDALNLNTDTNTPTMDITPTFIENVKSLYSKMFNDSVMEPDFLDGLLADQGAPINYDNIQSAVGGRLRQMFIDPNKEGAQVVHKGMSGEPLTVDDAGKLIMSMADWTVAQGFGSGALHGVDPNVLASITSVKPWADDFPKAFNHTSLAAMKKQLLYAEGKAGGKNAAASMVDNLIKKDKAVEMGQQFPNAMLVAPHAIEATGTNQIPQQFAERLSSITGLPVDIEIVQASKAYRTGKGAAEKIISRPEFDGAVIKGQEYILIDDVLAQGGTMSELRHYIENNGGKVVAVSPLTYARGSGILGVKKDTIQELKRRFNKDEFEKLLQDFNISGTTEAITEREGRYFLRFKSLDTIRNKLIEAGQER